mmetsp:Transcript_36179/g.41342  ORF Transcript_36179/g.41342 Transcript_36179/m.41342 type:complete len:232 (-) Transcript_36179:155-850(-)
MGKKSKRKSTNKPSPCYHGCLTKKNFNSGEHYKVLERWDDGGKKDINEFYKTNKRVLDDPTFGNFLIAHVTDDYLKGKDDATLRKRLFLLVMIRYVYIPRNEGKDVDSPESKYTRNRNKYIRDINTERGRIKFMAREIPCKCMEAKRIEAQSMERVAMCFGCYKDFPKENMLRCKCNHVQYCSTECSKKDWPRHKARCRKCGVSSAPTPTPEPVSSSVGEPSDVDVDAEEE